MKNKSRKFSLIAFLLVMAICNVCAENYPYRSDFLWVTAPNHADWLYKTGEKAQVEVQLYRYGVAQDGEVTYTIGRDKTSCRLHFRQNEELFYGKGEISVFCLSVRQPFCSRKHAKPYKNRISLWTNKAFLYLCREF